MCQIKKRHLFPLFYSPLLVFEVPNSQALNKSLLRDIAPMRNSTNSLGRSNRGGWHSEDDLFSRPEQSFRQLCMHIFEAVNAANHTVSPNVDFSTYDVQAQGWVSILGKAAFNVPHEHPNWSWSGVYYVKVPNSQTERSGNIEFLDTRTNIYPTAVPGAPCFDSKFSIKPEEGWVLVFPSYLKHWVYPNDSDEERVAIAFNMRFIEKTNQSI